MKVPQLSGGSLGRTKNILHFAQAFIIFLAWALTIAVWTKGGGSIDGRTVWYWVLCWISLPALVYLAAVPMWPRARRFGNVYAFATVDLLYTIFWFSAWICLASYVAQGKSLGKSTDSDSSSKDSSSSSSSSSSSKNRRADKTIRATSTTTSSSSGSGCDNWHYGSASKCKLSEAVTIIGVIIFILFAVTAYMSIRNVLHFRRTGTLPDAVSDPTFAAQSKAAFSSNPAHDFEEDDDDFRSSRAGALGSSRGDRDEDYALLNQSEIDDLGNGRTAMHGAYDPTESNVGSSIMHDYNSTPYGGAHGQHYAPPAEAYTPSDYGSTVAGFSHRG